MSLLLTYIFIVLGVSFICSMLESVILSVTHSHIGTLIKSNPKRGKILQALKDDINRPLAAILTINTVANTVGAAGVGAQTLQVFGSETVAVISIGANYWKQLIIPSSIFIRFLMILTFPFVWLSIALSSRMEPKEDDQKRVSREEIAVMAEMGEDEGSLDEQESDIIENLLQLKNISVNDILTPRSVIFGFEDKQTVGEAMDLDGGINFSRIPIFNENIDNVIGIVYKDTLLETMADDFFEKTMSEISKPVDTVFENESVESVLKKFISKRSHMFIVKDEFGGTTGLVTLEDCIETLLGVEIMDESDKVADMRKLAKDQLRQERKAKDKN